MPRVRLGLGPNMYILLDSINFCCMCPKQEYETVNLFIYLFITGTQLPKECVLNPF